MSTRELFVSVDVEASGPYPGRYSMLSLGACLVDEPMQNFFCEFKPLSIEADAKAMEVTGLSLERLAREGLDPAEAMQRFATWTRDCASKGSARPIFVGFNAAFDWAFVNHYFLHFVGNNPFGFAPLDIKSFYMGAARSTWSDTRSSTMSAKLGASSQGDHQALHDAQFQADLFRLAQAL